MKKISIFILIFFIGNCVIAQVPAYVDTALLLAWYPFNDNANNAYTATDNGVPYGGVSYGTDRFGSVLSCYVGNGASGIDIPVNNFVTGNGSRSVASWYKMPLPAPTGNREIFATGNNVAIGDRFGMCTDITYLGWESVGIGVVHTLPVDSSWHHIVVTYPVAGAGSGSIKVYFDGILASTFSVGGSVPVFSTATGPIHCIGSLFMPVSYGSWLYSWIGSLDDMGVWGREITPCEVSYLYYAGNSSLAFVNGHNPAITICENAISVSMDSILAVNDADAGLTDTWSIYMLPLHGALTGTYSTTATGSTMIPTGFSYTPTTGYTGLDSFKVIVHDCGNTADTTTVHITITPSTTAGAISGPSTVCAGALVTLAVTLTGGTWSATNTSATVSGGVVTGVIAGMDTIVYSVATSCGINTATKVITVNPLPPAPVLSSPAIYCRFAAYTPPIVPGSAILWYTAATGGTGSATPPSISTSDTGSYYYWVTQTASGCESARTPLTITVVSPFAVVEPKDTSICFGQSFQMRVTGAAGQSYIWSPAVGLSSNTAMEPVVTPSVTTSYVMIASIHGSSTSCADTLNAVVAVTRLNVNAGSYPNACLSSSVQLGASPSGSEYSYIWKGPAGFAAAIQAPLIKSVQLSAQGVYSLTVVDNTNGCSGQDTVTLTISDIAPPSVNLGADSTVCSKYILSLPAITKETAYLWSDGNKGQSIEISETGTYWVTASNICGRASDTVNVTVGICDIGLPTAFSPNGDGKNDILYVRGSGIKTLDLKIFNRFGQMIFETAAQQIGWDGTFNGQPQPVDVYGYVLNAAIIDGTTKVLKGYVTLLR